jgi:formylglycine-generating enzyme required for sulfatase activity
MFRTLILAAFMLMSIFFLCPLFADDSGNSDPQNSEPQTVSQNMVLVEGGTFTMGNTAGKGENDEIPTHSVTLPSFYICKYEVTQKLWNEVMSFNHSHGVGDDLPVEGVSSYECFDFCNNLSLKEGLKPCYTIDKSFTTCDWSANGYRLLTEAEWEYAAKGGKLSQNYLYSGSNSLDEVAWYKANSGGKTHPVGQKQPNELGIYDMTGNVREWCWDWLEPSYYGKSPAEHPKGADVGYYRVLRGGAWNYKDKQCRVANRDYYEPYIGYSRHTGLRICRNK